MPKQSPSQRTGTQAEALVAKVVADMGFIWRSKQPDFGIDGEIEVVDRSGVVTGAVALVQVKGTQDRFPGEGPDRFSMSFRREHIDYWMRCQQPVLAVCVSVARQQAWWKRLDVWFSDARRRSRRSVEFDKTEDVFDPQGALAVAAASTPVTAPLALLPTEELLTTNLLEIASFGPEIFTATTSCRGRGEAWELMRKARSFEGGFHLNGGRIYSLTPIEGGPLAVLANGAATCFSTAEWAETEDDDTRWKFTGLLNYTLRSIYHPDIVFHADKKIVYAPGTDDLRPTRVKGRAKRSRGRTFFAPHYARDDLNKVTYCKHYAADLRFRRWEGQWYLEINPTYHYTIDGRRDSMFASEYLAGIKRLERNRAVLELVRAWADFLKRTDQPSLFGGADNRIVFGELATVGVDAAIDERVWIVGYEPDVPPAHGLFDADEVGA